MRNFETVKTIIVVFYLILLTWWIFDIDERQKITYEYIDMTNHAFNTYMSIQNGDVKHTVYENNLKYCFVRHDTLFMPIEVLGK